MSGLIKRMDAPCKGCTDRKQGCHGQCEHYKAFRETMDERIKAQAQARAGHYCPLACIPCKERSKITANRKGRF